MTLDGLHRHLATVRRRLAAVRRPEYTGANRCWPCTAVNAVVVVVLAVGVGLYSRLLSLPVLAGGAVLVYLRGYVVPGTPRVAPRLVAPLPFDFGHDASDGPPDGVGSGSLGGDVDPEALMSALVDRGVLEPRGGDLFLDESFRAAWTDRMADLRAADDDELAERAAAAAERGAAERGAADPPAGGAVEGRVHGDNVLLAGGRDVWLRRPVAIAETAAVETLAEWDVPERLRAAAAEPLRTFIRTCPVCGGPVRETTLRNCCGGPGTTLGHPERAALACADCSASVFVFDDPDDARADDPDSTPSE
jgi:hypothetical protein